MPPGGVSGNTVASPSVSISQFPEMRAEEVSLVADVTGLTVVEVVFAAELDEVFDGLLAGTCLGCDC